ncbi:MAG TPA: hypothetical protein VML19_22600 [Verrucomicrobiae bacterium]|nr:hypothetical protein [Verrucomicrobiae bacterium]
MTSRLLPLFLAAAGAAAGAGHEFDRVVKAIEQQYGVKRTHIPLMGLANFVVKVAHPAGSAGLKLAVFEDLPDAGDPAELNRFMTDKICTGRLHPMIVTRERPSGESTYILTGELGKSTDLFIATFEPHEATVIEVTVNMETLLKMLAAPGKARGMFESDRDRDDGR